MNNPAPNIAPEAPAMNIIHALFSFQGRMRRQHYFICLLFIIATQIIALIHPLLTLLLFMPLFWCSLATNTKRLHDMEYSGWMMMVPVGVLIATFLIILLLAVMNLNGLADLMSYPYLVFLAGWCLWLTASSGTTGANQYGPDPKLPIPSN